LKSEATRNGC